MSRHESYLRNPFLVKGVVERIVRREGQRLVSEMIDPETGELMPLYTPDRNEVLLHDPKPYIKLFADSWQVLLSLSDAARRLVVYMTSLLRPNWDTVFLNPEDVVLHCRMSKSTYYRVIDELLEAKLLARKKGSHLEYFINPNILFNGNRIRLFSHNKQNVQAEGRDDKKKSN